MIRWFEVALRRICINLHSIDGKWGNNKLVDVPQMLLISIMKDSRDVAESNNVQSESFIEGGGSSIKVTTNQKELGPKSTRLEPTQELRGSVFPLFVRLKSRFRKDVSFQATTNLKTKSHLPTQPLTISTRKQIDPLSQSSTCICSLLTCFQPHSTAKNYPDQSRRPTEVELTAAVSSTFL